MKLTYSNWHKELVHDDTIRTELNIITDGALEFSATPFIKHRNAGFEREEFSRNNNNNRRQNFNNGRTNNNNNRPNTGSRDNRTGVNREVRSAGPQRESGNRPNGNTSGAVSRNNNNNNRNFKKRY